MRISFFVRSAALVPWAAMASIAAAEPTDNELERGGELVVVGRSLDLVGETQAASDGYVGADQILGRPLLRAGEVLETVPGVVVTQHSGSGKANQYFLRGFNLDHGTDFATTVGGMPVNMRSHGHGQGYTDLNFLIPETVESIAYRKGTHHAESGDFASAGAADIALATDRPSGHASLTGGMDQYARAVVTDTPRVGGGRAIYAAEAQHYDGPWVEEENLRRINGLLGYARGDDRNGWTVLAMGYRGEWDSTDQVPSRAVDSGAIDRLGTIDPSSGGDSDRASLSAELRLGDEDRQTVLSAYAIRYTLDLWSNFTYALDDPANGDQFQQVDRRSIYGGAATHGWAAAVGGVRTENQVGVQARHDAIGEVALHRTRERERLSTVRSDEVDESSVGVYARSTQHWTPWLRTTPSLRADAYRFDVESDNPVNSGRDDDGIVSPKFMVALGPWADTEYYLAAGFGFHSNDARGATITVDPVTGVPVERVEPLVRTRGAEVGARTSLIEGLQSTLAVWVLRLDSELLFVGDAGTTEASRPSQRAGIEWTNFWTPHPAVAIDADLALSRSRFRDEEPAGDHIPGSVEHVLAAGVTFGYPVGWFGTLRLRYFGPRPLVEDDSVRSDATTLVNAEAGYRWQRWGAWLSVFNLLDSKSHDIDYVYESQLTGEPGPVSDVHYHPVEPLTVRATLSARF